jgi:glycosyltransferase involved in cell wall biosynthesis
LRILIISQYFWPENFRINEVVHYFKKKNYEIDVLTGQPNYPSGKLFTEYNLNKKKYSNFFGAKIYRVPVFLRRESYNYQLFLNYISFVISAIIIGFFLLRRKKYDAILTFGTSPITSAIPGIFYSKIKNCKSILWVLDLWPEILYELKIINHKLLYFLLRKLVNSIYNKYDLILAQSQSFVRAIKRNTKNKNIINFYSWPENFYIYSKKILSKKKKIDNLLITNKNKLKIVFAGNVGEAQNFDNVIKAINILKNNNKILWIIVGTGRKIDFLKERIKDENINNVILAGNKKIEEVPFYLKLADILLVSLKSGKGLSATIPGKLQTYLSTNKFILGFLKGEAEKIINESKIGITCNPNNPRMLAKIILKLQNNKKLYDIIHYKRGTKYINKFFRKETILAKLNNIIINIKESYLRIKLISDIKNIPFNKNFSLSGLNLAFIGFLSNGRIKLHKNVYTWPDGIFYKRFFYQEKIKKISGRELLQKLKIPYFIKNIYIIGNLSNKAKEILKNLYKKNIVHIPLEHGSANDLYYKSCPKFFLKSDLVILTLPTPKQEEFSQLIAHNQKNYKVLCIGGALAMLSGEEEPVPKFLDNLSLEFLWRLRSETRRRLGRLIITFCYYLIGELKMHFYYLRRSIFSAKS